MDEEDRTLADAPTAPGMRHAGARDRLASSYAPPHHAPSAAPSQPGAGPRYDMPHLWPQAPVTPDVAEAQFIHPGAARAATSTQYGVPVYRVPVVPPVAVAQQRTLSISALVLGLCSMVFGWVFGVVPIIGIVFGVIALRQEPAGRPMAIAGLVTSAIGLLLVAVLFLLPLAAFFGSVFIAPTGP